MNATADRDDSAVRRISRFLLAGEYVTREQLAKALELRSQAVGTTPALLAVLVANGVFTKSKALKIQADILSGRRQVTETAEFPTVAANAHRTQEISPADVAPAIPGYDIRGQVGAGSMGVVYKARQRSLRRDVAIKLLPRHLAANAKFLKRFYREARAAAQLNHPNVVGALDIGKAGAVHYFVMEYIQGETALERLRRTGPLAEEDALRVAGDVARAIDHASAHGITHRDIKPDNIMLAADGTTKVCDFGLARAQETSGESASSVGPVGTPWYVSPEQANSEPVDARSDLYALGATLFHLLTGSPPYEARSPVTVMLMHIHDPVPNPADRRVDLRPEVSQLIQRLMAKDPLERPQSAIEFLAELELVQRRPDAPTGRSGLLKPDSRLFTRAQQRLDAPEEIDTTSLRFADEQSTPPQDDSPTTQQAATRTPPRDPRKPPVVRRRSSRLAAVSSRRSRAVKPDERPSVNPPTTRSRRLAASHESSSKAKAKKPSAKRATSKKTRPKTEAAKERASGTTKKSRAKRTAKKVPERSSPTLDGGPESPGRTSRALACPSCGARNAGRAKKCASCGKPLKR